jgi:hypothetical protein
MVSHGAWAVAVVLGLAGCSSGPASNPGHAGSRPDPEHRLAAAVDNLTTSNTGQYSARLVSDGDDVWSESGVYRIAPPAYAATRVVHEGRHTLDVRYVTIGEDSWFGFASAGAAPPCWLKVTPDVLEGMFGTGMAAVGRPLPVAVAVPAGARAGTGVDDDTVRAQADLVTTSTIFSTVFHELQGLGGTEPVDIPVAFDLDGDRFAGWSVTFGGIVRAATTAGHPVDESVAHADATFTATLSEAGEPVPVEKPSEGVLDVGAGSMEDFETTMTDCLGPGAGTRP